MRWPGAIFSVCALALALAAPAGADPIPGTCSWPVRSQPDAVNVAFPDENATYWVTAYVPVPATGMVLRGHYPHARYFSLHAYDALQRPVDALADFEIRPDAGDNPFVRKPRGPVGTWTVHVVPGARPKEGATPNTLYAGKAADGNQNTVAAVMLRVYVPDDPKSLQGGVPLPTVTMEAGNTELASFAQCDPIALVPDTGLNGFVRDSNWPVAGSAPADDAPPPVWRKFFSIDRTLVDALLPAGPVHDAVRGALPPSRGGFYSNVHNSYISALIKRNDGEIIVFRGHMPSFPDTRAGVPARARRNVRYWSICQNELATQRYVGCVADYQSVRDRAGYATFVISDPADRPKNATREAGVNWLPWGGAYADSQIIYRQMVAAPSFARSIERVQDGEDLRKAMGIDYPVIAMCTKARFEDRGADGCLGR